MHQFNPHYQLPTRKHFTKVTIPALVNDVKSKTEEQIKSNIFQLQQTSGNLLLGIHT